MQVNIGKNGLTEGIISALEIAFRTRKDVKVSVLKSGGHDREKIKQMAEEIISRLGNKFTYRVVGFTIFAKKWKRAMS